VIAMTRDNTRQAILSAMRNEGECLVLIYENGELVWRLLHSGRRVSPSAVRNIVQHADVRSAYDRIRVSSHR
jgi:hypothetical protein